MSEKIKQTIWRQSASLILVANTKNELSETTADKNCDQHLSNNESFDYNLLLFTRSDQTAMVTNQCVFPGGLFESADESVLWLNYFKDFGVTESALKRLIVTSEERPTILAQQGTGCYDRFFARNKIWAREISLRITALRETFEEVGILLCRSKEQLDEIAKEPKTATTTSRNKTNNSYAYFKDNFDRKYWQHIVHNDASEFLHLCQMLNVVPDLWSLYEWAAWASPAPIKKGDETVFFITFLKEAPTLQVDPIEVKECMWQTPTYFINSFREGNIWFLLPQLYELSRFKGVSGFEVLLEFTLKRQHKNITLYIGIFYACTDGVVSVLPGDDLYLSNPRNVENYITIDKTIAEFRAEAKNYHRLENVGANDMQIYFNIQPLNGHLSPVKDWHGNYKL